MNNSDETEKTNLGPSPGVKKPRPPMTTKGKNSKLGFNPLLDPKDME